MLRLDSTVVLQAVLSGAVATTQPQATVCASDHTSPSTYVGLAPVRTALNSTTDVTILGAPAGATIRDVDYLGIFNRDTAAITVTLKYDATGVDTIITTFTLLTLETLLYIHGTGWVTLAANGAVKMATTVSGILLAVNGGTGFGAYAVGDLLYADTTTTLARLADVAAGSYLRSGGVGVAPLWSTLTLPNSATVGDLPYASATNVISNLADVATGNALISGGVAAIPSWGKIGLTTHVSGTLPVANGGTGVTTSTGTGSVVLSAGPTFTGDPLAPTAAENDSDTSIATTAFVAANIPGMWGSINNTSKNNAGTPNTQFDLTADVVVLRNTNNHIVVRYAPGTITNNVSTAGSTANGRDQAGAFSASSWIHFYWIWNGSTLATLSSAVAPTTGPTLPSGYTHWAYCGAVRFGAGSTMPLIRMRDDWVFQEARTVPLNNGAATTETSVDISAFVPPNALEWQFETIMTEATDATGKFDVSSIFRIVSGSNFWAASTLMTGLGALNSIISPPAVMRAPNVGQAFLYLNINTTGSVTFTVVCHGYRIPNRG